MYSALILAGLSILCFVPALWSPPVPMGDLTHHLQITNAYAVSFAEGSFPPDIVERENNDFGSITVRFYPPLMHITVAVFKVLGARMHLAIFLGFCVWSFIGGWGAFLLARETLGPYPTSILPACLFVISPYHLNQFYNSFMWGEFASLSVLPF